MKRSALHTWLDRLVGLIKRRTNQRPPASVYKEMYRGSLVGLLACVLLAAWAGQDTGRDAMMVAASFLGAGAGALIGLLLWLGSDTLAEEPIPPPRQRWLPVAGLPPRAASGHAAGRPMRSGVRCHGRAMALPGKRLARPLVTRPGSCRRWL